jgi:hypothetical protein
MSGDTGLKCHGLNPISKINITLVIYLYLF